MSDKKPSNTTLKRGKVSGSSQDDKASTKLPNAASRSPAPRPQKASAQKKGKDSGQSQPASASATGGFSLAGVKCMTGETSVPVGWLA